jgi:hypothetical protein
MNMSSHLLNRLAENNSNAVLSAGAQPFFSRDLRIESFYIDIGVLVFNLMKCSQIERVNGI